MTRRAEAFREWRTAPASKEFFAVIEAKIAEYEKALAGGSLLSHPPADVAMHYANVVGVIAGLREVVEYDVTEEDA